MRAALLGVMMASTIAVAAPTRARRPVRRVMSAGPPHLRAVEAFRRAGTELEIRLDCSCADPRKLEGALALLFYAWRPIAAEVGKRVPACSKLVGVLLARLPSNPGVPLAPDQLLVGAERQIKAAAPVNSNCVAVASIPRRLLRAAGQLRAAKLARDAVAREITLAMEDVEDLNGSLFE